MKFNQAVTAALFTLSAGGLPVERGAQMHAKETTVSEENEVACPYRQFIRPILHPPFGHPYLTMYLCFFSERRKLQILQLIFPIHALIFLWTDLEMAGVTWVQTMVNRQVMCLFPFHFPYLERSSRVFGLTTTVALAFRQILYDSAMSHPG
jgi:phosphotransferase system  glucose/maltose/N-acetylglucosamine-specific IIC component